MTGRTKDDELISYVCGRCRYRIDYLKSDDPPVPCPECGYQHKDRRVTDVPPETKFDLTQL